MSENGREKRSYEFADFTLEIGGQRLLRGLSEIHLPQRQFQILLCLVENRDFVVSRHELLERFWDGHDVYDDVLGKSIGAIRRALDDTGKTPRHIETRRGSGYRFIGPVTELNDDQTNSIGVSPAFQNGDGKTNSAPIEPSIGGQRAFRNRSVLLAVFSVIVILIAAFSFFSIRREDKTVSGAIAAPNVATRHFIAILPIKNLTGTANNDYLSDGITESLINEVSRIENLKVISRGSAFQFRDKDVSAREIGERLGVETILEGGLRLSGEQIRLDVRLVSAKDGSVLWASDYEKEKLTDIFAIQDGITCQIVTELRVKLCGEVAPSERYTKNVKAYQLYLKGMYYRNQLSKENLAKAVVFFEKALVLEPDYALAHEGLAAVYTVLESNSHVPPGTAAPNAIFHAEKALQLDDSLSNALLFLGTAKTLNNYDIKIRDIYYDQALVKNPNSRTARLWLANDLTVQGRFEEAEFQILRAQELDPLSYGVRMNLSELYYYWRKPDKAIELGKLMLLDYPNDPTTIGLMAKAYAQKGDFDDAFAMMNKLSPNNSNRAMVLASAGKIDEARKVIDATIASEKADVSPYWIACLYAVIGEREISLEWLEKAYTVRQADLVSMKVDPALDSIRNDPRYADLLLRVNLAD